MINEVKKDKNHLRLSGTSQTINSTTTTQEVKSNEPEFRNRL